jgi:hypothetical protein
VQDTTPAGAGPTARNEAGSDAEIRLFSDGSAVARKAIDG